MKPFTLLIALFFNIFLAIPALAAEKTKEPPPKPKLIESVEKLVCGRTLKNPEIDSVSVFISPVLLKFSISF